MWNLLISAPCCLNIGVSQELFKGRRCEFHLASVATDREGPKATVSVQASKHGRRRPSTSPVNGEILWRHHGPAIFHRRAAANSFPATPTCAERPAIRRGKMHIRKETDSLGEVAGLHFPAGSAQTLCGEQIQAIATCFNQHTSHQVCGAFISDRVQLAL